MDIVLIPGLWLDGSSWEEVVPALQQAGHRTHALTLPGMESKDADRSKITLRDHVDAVVAVIDSFDPADGEVVLVGHSGGGAIAHAAVDARPDRVARVVYVDSVPLGDGGVINDAFPAENGDVPLPDWSLFDEEDLIDLDEELRARFRERAIPAPVHVASDPQQLTDERRYEVPITVISCEFPSAMLRELIEQGMGTCRSSRRSATSTTSICQQATGRNSPGPKSSARRSSPASAPPDRSFHVMSQLRGANPSCSWVGLAPAMTRWGPGWHVSAGRGDNGGERGCDGGDGQVTQVIERMRRCGRYGEAPSPSDW